MFRERLQLTGGVLLVLAILFLVVFLFWSIVNGIANLFMWIGLKNLVTTVIPIAIASIFVVGVGGYLLFSFCKFIYWLFIEPYKVAKKKEEKECLKNHSNIQE